MIFKRASIIIALCLLISPSFAQALTSQQALVEYKQELISAGLDEENADLKALNDLDEVITGMSEAQKSAVNSLNNLDTRVRALQRNDSRRAEALEALESAQGTLDFFVTLRPEFNLDVQPTVGGALPRILPLDDFTVAQTRVNEKMAAINIILIGPSRPGTVPTGDWEDFITNTIRQLFRFAWVAILISMTIAGLFLILARGNDERIAKAKRIMYYNIIGFAFIALSFALVRAATDIDFFNFI